MAKKTNKSKWHLARWQQIALYLMAYDFLAVNGAYFAALFIRFDLQYSAIPAEYLSAFLLFAPFYTVFCLFTFWKSKLYKSLWQYASINEASHVIIATVITTLFQIIGITLFVRRMPISYYIFV